MRTIGRLRLLWLLSAMVLASCPLEVAAVRVQLGAGLEAEYSSNVLRTSDNAEDDLIGSAWGAFSVQERSANLAAEVAGSVDQRWYLDDTVDDEALFAFASLVDWYILRDRLSWHFEDYFQQVRVDVLEPLAPDNRQDSNILWTGPDLHLRISKIYFLDAAARYGNFYYEETDADNDRYSGSLRVGRRLSELSSVYIGAQSTAVRYEDSSVLGPDGVRNTDYDQREAWLGYLRETRLTTLRLEAGRTYIERDGLPDADGFLGRASLSRRLAHDSTFGVALYSRYSQSGTELLATAGDRLDADPTEADAVQDIAYERRADAYFATGRWGFDLRTSLFARQLDYELADDLDREAFGTATTVGFAIARGWEGNAHFSYARTDYPNRDFADDDFVVGAGVEHRLSRDLTFIADVRANIRESSGTGRDFNEFVGLLGLRYGDRPTWIGAQ